MTAAVQRWWPPLLGPPPLAVQAAAAAAAEGDAVDGVGGDAVRAVAHWSSRRA